MEGVTARKSFSKGTVVFEATTYIKKYGSRHLESHWCAKESPKMHLIDTHCGCEKGRNYHRKFALKGVTSVFAVLAVGKYYRMYSSWVQEIFS